MPDGTPKDSFFITGTKVVTTYGYCSPEGLTSKQYSWSSVPCLRIFDLAALILVAFLPQITDVTIGIHAKWLFLYVVQSVFFWA